MLTAVRAPGGAQGDGEMMSCIFITSQVKIQFNPPKIATKGFSTDSGRV